MYRFFINDRPLVLLQQGESPGRFAGLEEVFAPEDARLMDLVRHLEEPRMKGLLVWCKDSSSSFQSLKAQFTSIHAGGGVVFNQSGALLLMKRLGKWDLPKGKTDPGETMEEAALREVQEECGIPDLTARKFFRDTYHTYKIQGHRFLKITHWYLMDTVYDGPLVPQLEESITEVIWQNPEMIDLNTLDTYESIRDLLTDLLTNQE